MMKRNSSWVKSVMWGIYHFFMIVLLITNTVFLISHWRDLRIDLSESSLLLTFVGFLFAFAGINIYSIFNTNVEEEKKRLNDIYIQYKKEIAETVSLLNYSKKLINYYQLSQMIVASRHFSSQSFDRITSINMIIADYKSFLKRLYDKEDIKMFNEYKKDFIEVSRGIRDSLNTFYNDGKLPRDYFSSQTIKMKNSYKEQICQLIANMNELEGYDYTGEIIVMNNNTPEFGQRFKVFIESFINLFKTK